MKKYPCQKCGREVSIRTRIKDKDSDDYNKMLCGYCVPKKSIKTTPKVQQTRLEQRKTYPEFFKKHIAFIKETKATCIECGQPLTGHASEVAHIFSKSKNPEIAIEDDNILYLCGMYSENQCHHKFDNAITNRCNLKTYSIVVERYNRLKDKITNSNNTEITCLNDPQKS